MLKVPLKCGVFFAESGNVFPFVVPEQLGYLVVNWPSKPKQTSKQRKNTVNGLKFFLRQSKSTFTRYLGHLELHDSVLEGGERQG